MKYKATLCGAIVTSLSCVLLLPAGCGTGITADTTLPDALSLLAQATSQDSALSQLTVGDLVAGFLSYSSQLTTSSGDSATTLTSDQETQLEALQGQLDRGEITEDEFIQQIRDLIGDPASGFAFAGMGMMGGPFGGDPGSQLADQLGLTDEQQQQADDIFTRLHTDLDTLRQNAQDQINALLTEDQLTTLQELLSEDQGLPAPDSGGSPGHHPGGMGGPGMGSMGNEHGPDGPPPDDANAAGADLGPIGRFADELQLTDDQIAAIEQIHADLRTAVEARHQQARDEFRAILTADQLALLDELEAQGPPH